MNPKADALLEFAREQLENIPGIRFHRMFGGYGIYSGDTFFGIIHGESLYFHTNPETQKRYEDAGTSFFVTPGKRVGLKKYYEVPPEIVERKNDLIVWARESIGSAEKKAKTKSANRTAT